MRAGMTPAERAQAAGERLVAALHALGMEEFITAALHAPGCGCEELEGEETLAGAIAGTQLATEACVDGHQLRTAEMWTALGDLATAVRDHLIEAAAV